MAGYKFLFESLSTMIPILRMQHDFSVAQICRQSRSPASFPSPEGVLLPLLADTAEPVQAGPANQTGRKPFTFLLRDQICAALAL